MEYMFGADPEVFLLNRKYSEKYDDYVNEIAPA